MGQRPVGKRDPSHKPLEHPRVNLEFNELQTSTGALREHLGTRKEHDRIIEILRKEEADTNSSYITYDRIRRLLSEGR